MRTGHDLRITEIKRMRDLIGAGLSCEAVCRMMQLDYGISVSQATVRKYAGGDYPMRLGAGKPKGLAGVAVDNGANLR